MNNWSSGIFSFFFKIQGLDRTADLYFEMAQYMAGYSFDHVIHGNFCEMNSDSTFFSQKKKFLMSANLFIFNYMMEHSITICLYMLSYLLWIHIFNGIQYHGFQSFSHSIFVSFTFLTNRTKGFKNLTDLNIVFVIQKFIFSTPNLYQSSHLKFIV